MRSPQNLATPGSKQINRYRMSVNPRSGLDDPGEAPSKMGSTLKHPDDSPLGKKLDDSRKNFEEFKMYSNFNLLTDKKHTSLMIKPDHLTNKPGSRLSQGGGKAQAKRPPN